MSEIIGLYEAKTHLSQLVDRAAQGEEIVIAKNVIPLVRLTPAAFVGQERKPAGVFKVTFMSDDFDDPLPPEIRDAFEGLC
jgi:prevent-host-death family protein